MLQDDNSQSKNIVAVKSILHEQLCNLAERFANICKEDTNDYQEMKGKITGVIEDFCISIDNDKFVSLLILNHNSSTV